MYKFFKRKHPGVYRYINVIIANDFAGYRIMYDVDISARDTSLPINNCVVIDNFKEVTVIEAL
jgi:hypothetical protein